MRTLAGGDVLTLAPPEEWTDDGSNDIGFEGWYAIEIKPYRCPGCRRDLTFVCTGDNHAIIVWPAIDDPALLEVAQAFLAHDDPHVVPYEAGLGPCISFYDWKGSRE